MLPNQVPLVQKKILIHVRLRSAQPSTSAEFSYYFFHLVLLGF